MEITDKCENCGGKIEYRQEDSIQGGYCENCGWLYVTSYFPPIILDDTHYKIYLLESNSRDKNQIRIVSKITGMNYLSVRKLLQQDKPLIFEGKATSIINIKDNLSSKGILYEILPKFNY